MMTWTTAPLWAVTALYGSQIAIAAVRGDGPTVAIIGGYVIANLGLIWSMQNG